MDKLPDSERAENPGSDLPYEEQETDDWPSPAESAAHSQSLAGGAGLSLALSLLALVLITANQQLTQFLRAQTEPTLAISIAAIIVMALTLLIAAPSGVVAVVFALGSLITGQRRWALAVLALLISAVSATMFLAAG